MVKDFLVEIGTEELPPKALRGLATSFCDEISKALNEKDLSFKTARWFATPRRLSVIVEQLEDRAADKAFEIHGPPMAAAKDKDGNWTKAALGFAAKNNVAPEKLSVAKTDKGERLAVSGTSAGEKAIDCLPAIIHEALKSLPIPKRMRWGAGSDEFVRPVHWSVMLYGDQVVPATILGTQTSNQTRGHRFHCDTTLEIANPGVYEKLLEESGHVIVDFNRRQSMIREQVEAKAKKLGGVAVIDQDLLDEVTGLVEFPVALAGSFEERFLDVPAEALISSMKEHQKYFHVVDGNGKLLPNFITVSNIVSQDPAQVISGNERVIRPRLSDAAFFFETDKKTTLASRVDKLKTIVFQQKLGTLFNKAERVKALAGFIANQLNSNVADAERAALLAKTDLVSDMVSEFDTMQGIAGYYYALNDGESVEVAEAIKEQYLPKFSGDDLPTSHTSCAVALADRLDTLVGIFGIGQPPTGSKDPFALRRASLGILRIIVEKQLPLDLKPLLEKSAGLHKELSTASTVVDDVLAYMIERFRAWYEEDNIPVQVFQAVSAKNISEPLDFDQRVKAVFAFNQLPEAQALAAANKRVSNILAKYDGSIPATLNESLFTESAEKTLAILVKKNQQDVEPLFATGNYTQGLTQLASLRESIDAFFDSVMVMVDDQAVKENRVVLLSQLRDLFLHVADISLLASAN